MSNRTKATAAKLRAIADLLDSIDPPVPCVWGYSTGSIRVQWQLLRDDDTARQKAEAQAIVRSVGGKWKKSGNDDTFSLTQDRGGITYEILVQRDAVCTRRVVGTETVEHPAVEAREAWTEEREVVEWDCESVLAEAVA